MRIHLGSDHAGLESRTTCSVAGRPTATRSVDYGPFVYDAVDDYPVFCLRAAEAVAADQAEGWKLGVVIGGSGNGEQIAANKVPGSVPRWLVRRHRNPGPGAQRRQRDRVGGRMHSGRGHDPVRRSSWQRRSATTSGIVRRIGQIAAYETEGVLPPLPASALDGPEDK